ncbi:MAG: CDC48 family AAA ATPase [Nanohaloarchaea archaeon]|nr:CDC48 family AAA ATPase [Candidatus Nanohaloarchaea archaeon]
MDKKDTKDVKGIEVRVGEMPSNAQRDIGMGIVRMDTQILHALGLREGDVCEIEGKRKTGAIVLRPYPSDAGLKIIRMDGYTRRNAVTGIGEKVFVRKSELKEAKSISIAPAEKGIEMKISSGQAKSLIMGRVVSKGDLISPSVRTRQRQPDFGDLFGMDIDVKNMLGGFGFSDLKLIVAESSPKGIVKITDQTEVKVLSKAVEVTDETTVSMTYEDIGGLHEEVKKVREMIELPMKHPELFQKLGIDPPKGVLLYGPPGTGKTLLARAVASESGVNFYSIAGPEVMSKFYGESEENVRKIFNDAEENAPSIIFIDEIDSLAPKRENSGEVERRVVAQLLSLMDGLKSRGQVIVIAATNIINSIDPALRRGGRFDREIEIGVPTRDGRKEILQIHTRNMPLSKDVNISKIADVTYGYVGADLNALAKEAAMSSLRRILPEINLKDDTIDPKVIEKLEVNRSDFNNALLSVEPSAMREVMIEIPKVQWDDVGGLSDVKKRLMESIEWPLKYPDSFKTMGIRPPRGILLYGLPGTGKTLLAKAVANKSNTNFISIKGPEVFNKYVGESEKAIREVFKRARQVAPSIIFIDEIDAIAPKRGHDMDSGVSDRVVNQLLTEMDGLEGLEGVVVIAATNRPDIIDTGVLRPGRFDRHIYIPVPDKESRKKIFDVYLSKMPIAKDVKVSELISKSDNYVGADIESICREAALIALRKDIKSKTITKDDFDKAFDKVKPTVTKAEIESYDKKVDKSKISKEEVSLDYLG